MIMKILLRVLFVVFLPFFAVQAYRLAEPETLNNQVEWLYMGISFLVAIAIVIFEWRFQREIVREMVAIVFGLAAGLVISTLLTLILIAFFLPSGINASFDITLAFAKAFWTLRPWIPMILVACCYICITVVLQTRNDFRFLIPYIDFSQRGTQEGGVILDTSAIIDGRIVDICETRLISVPVVIPDFVLRELQTIADSADRLKRLRGRRGLDMVAQLQKSEEARVTIRDTDAAPGAPVDDELVRLAKEISARIITTDFNLNKVSQIEGVIVINVNDIANAMKPAVIPGDRLNLKIIRPGQEAGQGVGYLDDGTMVVVEQAREHIGEALDLEVTGSIQTSAGRMIFGKIADS